MMKFFEEHYGKKYAPNTRETVRRYTVHQFLQAALVVANPDEASRPVNSPKAVYQIEPTALNLLRSYKTPAWASSLKNYLSAVESLRTRYARERKMRLVSVTLAPGKIVELTPGGQNQLIRKIIEEFCARFMPGAQVVYVGDAGQKWAYFDQALLESLAVAVDEHGKMPDVVVYDRQRNWVVVIEAVTSHGPVNPKRHWELRHLFRRCKAGIIFVTAFSSRREMVKYLDEIAWETEVWIADAPSHMVHFNGERFLEPSKP